MSLDRAGWGTEVFAALSRRISAHTASAGLAIAERYSAEVGLKKEVTVEWRIKVAGVACVSKHVSVDAI